MANSSYSQIMEDSIKLHFERNGILDEMRSGLHVKVLNMMRGEKDLRKDEPLCGGDMKQRGLVQLLNYLVVDYFAWYGYKHTLETFALETGDKCQLKPRERLQREFGENFARKDLPILLQMVMKQTKKINEKNLPESPIQANISRKYIQAAPKGKDIPPEGSSNNTPNFPTTHVKPKDIQADDSAGKVNVREAMKESTKVLTNYSYAKRVKRSSPTLRKTRHSSEYESSSRCTTESGSLEETSDDSDAFATIPNRYYYREQELPEQTYPNGFGEEGPYEVPGQGNVRKQLRPQAIVKRKPLKIVEMRSDADKEMPQCSKKDTAKSANTKSSEQTSKRRTIYKSLMAVGKPNCPETMVGTMQESSDDSDEDTDDYL